MKRNITIAVLNGLVLNEAKQLKKLATLGERLNLSKYSLNPIFIDSCIYGQMTGSCFSNRAKELIHGSCKKVLKRGEDIIKYGSDGFIANTEFTGTLNGNPKNEKRDDYWSPIEVFITQQRNHKNDNITRLIAFLRDETKTLKLI